MSLSDGTEEDVGGEDGLSIITYDSEVEKKSRKKKSNKPPMLSKSPYLSNTYLHPKKAAVWRSLKGTGTIHIENPSVKVPRELWVASLRQGFVPTAVSQSLKSECDSGCSRSSEHTGTPEYLKEALGMKKPKHSRSASNGYVPGTPDYKEKEDMYDEIIELKKIIQAQKADYDILKTKLRRSEEENNRKEKQIGQLLNQSKSSEYARSLVDKKNDTSGIVNGLKQRIFKLEQQCKEKDGIVNKLQTDLKTTNIEEMKIAMETFYEEIQRLRLLLTNNDTVEKKSMMESRELQKEIKVLKSTILRLSKSLKQLQEENKTLKGNLEQESHSYSIPCTARGYNEWTKSRLVRRVLELEKKVSNSDNFNSKAGNRDIEEKLPQAECVTGQIQQQEQQQISHQQEYRRLQELTKKLKEDRSNLQTQLAEKEHEVSTLKERVRQLETELGDHRKMKKRFEVELEDHRRMKEKNDLVKKEEVEMEETSRASCSSTIQNQVLTGNERNEAISVIQSCFRAHLTRTQYLKGRKNLFAEDTRGISVAVRKSSDAQRQTRYSGFWRDNESSDEIEEDVFQYEDPEHAEYLKKLKISPNSPSSVRCSQSLYQTSGAVESDNSDDVILF
ncbi:IQ domain-containing protein E isoform X3 [Mobula birostris]|uniref:IQ domain-containing protein E isoform X3 n=1 Tax=Mobula birostris TaxID=1983395 RepID=UPI003B2837FA